MRLVLRGTPRSYKSGVLPLSHSGNTGSNPGGDANCFRYLNRRPWSVPQLYPTVRTRFRLRDPFLPLGRVAANRLVQARRSGRLPGCGAHRRDQCHPLPGLVGAGRLATAAPPTARILAAASLYCEGLERVTVRAGMPAHAAPAGKSAPPGIHPRAETSVTPFLSKPSISNFCPAV
jgi:hypothetical protein